MPIFPLNMLVDDIPEVQKNCNIPVAQCKCIVSKYRRVFLNCCDTRVKQVAIGVSRKTFSTIVRNSVFITLFFLLFYRAH